MALCTVLALTFCIQSIIWIVCSIWTGKFLSKSSLLWAVIPRWTGSSWSSFTSWTVFRCIAICTLTRVKKVWSVCVRSRRAWILRRWWSTWTRKYCNIQLQKNNNNKNCKLSMAAFNFLLVKMCISDSDPPCPSKTFTDKIQPGMKCFEHIDLSENESSSTAKNVELSSILRD